MNEKLLDEIKYKVLNKHKILYTTDELCEKNNKVIEHVKDIWLEIQYDCDLKVKFDVFKNNEVEYILKVSLSRGTPANRTIIEDDLVKEAFERSLYMIDYLDLFDFKTYSVIDYPPCRDIFVFKCRLGDASYKILDNSIIISAKENKDYIYEDTLSDFFRGNKYAKFYVANFNYNIEPQSVTNNIFNNHIIIDEYILKIDRNANYIFIRTALAKDTEIYKDTYDVFPEYYSIKRVGDYETYI